MATPTTKLQIVVDLSNGLITEIQDTVKKAVYSEQISLANKELANSKRMMNSVVKVMNNTEKTDGPSPIDNGAVAEEAARLAAAAAAVPGGPTVETGTGAVTGAVTDAAVVPGGPTVETGTGAVTGAVTDAAGDGAAEDAEKKEKEAAEDSDNEDEGTWNDRESDDEESDDEKDVNGGAFKRRLSRRRLSRRRLSRRRLSKRRPRGSNRKKSLVRNKSKKMRRGKYSRKAK